ncbi:hypothetical protein FS837_006545, partial [Tulasnella sp. UAMH 9824]
MSGKINEEEEASPPISTKQVTIDEVEPAMKRQRINPRKVLESLRHLRIQKVRIKPLESEAPIKGGKADVDAAILTPAEPSKPAELDDAEYVAVKKLRSDMEIGDDQALAPFAYEVNLLSELSHENVIKLIGFVEEVGQGVAWMVFLWEKNGNLREFVRSANLELPERVSLLNILVNSECRAIITDFGSARPVDLATAAFTDVSSTRATRAPATDSPRAELAASGEFITMTGPAWTVRWAAPELLEGELPGLVSDIWAFGWICWEAVDKLIKGITGNFPFDKESDVAAVLRIAQGDLPIVENDNQLKQIKALCGLMGECWGLNPKERPTADRTVPLRRANDSISATRSSGLLYALGRIRLRNNLMADAQKYFERSLEVATSGGDEQGMAKALEALGQAFYLQSEYSKAEDLYSQAHKIYSHIGDRLGIAQSLDSLGDVYRMRYDYSKAEESYIQARDIYSQIGSHLGFAQSIKSLGDVYRIRRWYSKAEELYIQARDIYSQLDYQLGLAQSVNSLGDLYRMRCEYSEAEEAYIQARNVYSQIGYELGFAQAVDSLGDVYYMRDEYSKAEESYIQARDLYSKIGSQLGFAQSVNSVGDVYRMRHEYSKAEESYIQARDIYSQIGDQLGFAQSVKGLGDVYYMREEYFKAEESYIQARNTARQIGDWLGFAQS